MKNQKSTKSALITSVIALLLCFAMLFGTTFAWFTDEVVNSNNIIKTGTLEVGFYYADSNTDGTIKGNWITLDSDDDDYVDGTKVFNYNNWEPGYVDVKYVKIANEGSLAFKYKLNIVPEKNASAYDLASQIEAYFAITDGTTPIDRASLVPTNTNLYIGTLDKLIADADGAAYGVLLPATTVSNADNALADAANAKTGELTACIALKMKETADNNYQGISVGDKFALKLFATQFTYEEDSFNNLYDEKSEYPVPPADEWDGTATTTWYNDTDTEFVLNTSEQIAGLAELVDDGNTFAGKTIKLEGNVDLYAEDANGERISFDPIGYGYNTVFKGEFDGQGYTISNLYQNGWALGLDYSTEGGGLFASVVDATIKNVNIDNAEIVMECIDMGVLVGYSYGDCTYENITVSNSKIANYQRYTGGVVGEVNGKQTFKNVDVKDTEISSLWGDFDCSLGGIIGGKWGDSTVIMEDCDVDCQINAYNDITSSYLWHAYRRAGMLIGNSEETATVDGRTVATATYLQAKNCTVTYGDWVNYTYCEFTTQPLTSNGTNPNSWPYVRVQGNGWGQCSSYSNPRYGVATDANGNKAVDDNHVHNDGEDHFIERTFDQLYGGGQGVYGTATHEGVTVIYNNK